MTTPKLFEITWNGKLLKLTYNKACTLAGCSHTFLNKRVNANRVKLGDNGALLDAMLEAVANKNSDKKHYHSGARVERGEGAGSEKQREKRAEAFIKEHRPLFSRFLTNRAI